MNSLDVLRYISENVDYEFEDVGVSPDGVTWFGMDYYSSFYICDDHVFVNVVDIKNETSEKHTLKFANYQDVSEIVTVLFGLYGVDA